MDKIIYWDTHETVLFAVEELERLMMAAGTKSSIGDRALFTKRNEEKFTRIILIGLEEYNSFMGENIRL
ncbi:hypothetical protein J4G37_60525, partial [Microvirga sp. 3-52]|nr:hypothetical protein [Microvirga sp. 3-52]